MGILISRSANGAVRLWIGVITISKIELKPCPFCGRKMVFHKEEFVNRYGNKVIEQYYTHEEKESVCILDEINMPFTIGAGDATDNYIGEYAELWNRRADNGKNRLVE